MPFFSAQAKPGVCIVNEPLYALRPDMCLNTALSINLGIFRTSYSNQM